MEQTENRELKSLLTNLLCMAAGVLRQWRVLLCAVLLVGMAADVVRTLNYQPRYSASVEVTVRSAENTYGDLEGAQSYLTALEYVLNGQVAQHFVRETIQAPEIPLHCTISRQGGTNRGTLVMTSDSRQHAYFGLSALLDWYRTTGVTLDKKYTLTQQDQVRFSPQPLTLNRHGRNFLLGGAVSAVLVTAALALLEFLRKVVRTPEDVEQELSCRLLAKIPREHKPRGKQFWKRSKQALLISSVKTSLPYREAIRKLRHKLEASAEKHHYKTILITSAGENEGKSSLVANLALSLAMNQHRVLLLDCDLLKPAIHKIFEQDNSKKNLNNYLLSKEKSPDWREQVIPLPRQHISVLPARPAECTEELLESRRLAQLLRQAREEYDYIIIDTPPAGALSDAVQLNALADASLLVVRQNSSGCDIINETIARMTTAKNNLAGCVYNARYAELFSSRSGSPGKYAYGRDR